MTFDFDTSKLSQAAARKITLHDNCIVLDLGIGSFPRDIEVRLPDDDGARQIAIWDGGLDLAINDEVLCNEYAGNPKWRVAGMGGADSGAGKQRVSEVWESDFGAVAAETDASGNVTINGTRTLTIPTDLIHAGDPDTMLSFTDDALEATIGNLSMLKLTETAQNLVEIGDVAGGGDVDIDFNNGQMFLRGSDGQLALAEEFLIQGTQDYSILEAGSSLSIQGQSTGVGAFVRLFSNDGDATDGVQMQFFGLGTPGSTTNRERLIFGWNTVSSAYEFQSEAGGSGTLRPLLFFTEGNSNQLKLAIDGNIGIGAGAPGSLMEWNMATEDLEFVDAGSAAATEQDWIEVQVGGATGYIHVHAAK